MNAFTLAEVARLANLSEARVRSLVLADVLAPTGAETGADAEAWRFSFRDLVLCRSARGLIEARVPPVRLTAALREVQAHLPEAQPLSGVALSADGRQVVARDGDVCWEVDTGQVRFEFEDLSSASPIVNIAPVSTESTEVVASSTAPVMTALDWFELGLELEDTHPDQARDAYRRALELDPLDRESRLNMARLLRQAGLLEPAEAHYRLGADIHAEDAQPMVDLGSLCEGQARWWDAVVAYERAAERSPATRDVYRRLASLYERLGESAKALGALKIYRSLTESPP